MQLKVKTTKKQDFSMSFYNILKFRFRRFIETRKHKLTYLFWECTLRCNMNCLHCGSDCKNTSDLMDMPKEDFVEVLDNIKSSGVKNLFICITGGEPLLRDDLEEIGIEIISRGFRWGIVTNALTLSPERFSSLLNAGLSSISFSLDGLEEEHSYMRQNANSFKKVEYAIKMASYVQREYSNRLAYEVITTVTPSNLRSLANLREYLLAEKVPMWKICSVFPEGRGLKNKEKLLLSNEEYQQMLDFIIDTKKNYGNRIEVSSGCEGFLGNYDLKIRGNYFVCYGGINVASLWCNGNIGACLSVRGTDFIQGNIYNERKEVANSFMKIWNTKFKNARNRSWAKFGKCKSCSNWKKCLGNGLHLHHDLKTEVSRCCSDW